MSYNTARCVFRELMAWDTVDQPGDITLGASNGQNISSNCLLIYCEVEHLLTFKQVNLCHLKIKSAVRNKTRKRRDYIFFHLLLYSPSSCIVFYH